MVEGSLIVLLVEGSTGINSVCSIHIRSPAIISRTVNTALVEQRDGLVQILVNLGINLGHARRSKVTGRLIKTQGQTLGRTIVGVFPALAVVVDQLLIAIGTEGQGRTLDELLVGITTLGIVNAIDNHISLGNHLIVVVPSIVVVNAGLIGVIGLVVDRSPTRSILVVVVVLAGIVLIQTHDGILTTETL